MWDAASAPAIGTEDFLVVATLLKFTKKYGDLGYGSFCGDVPDSALCYPKLSMVVEIESGSIGFGSIHQLGHDARYFNHKCSCRLTVINGGCRTLDLHIWTSRCDNSHEAGGFHGDPIYQ